MVWFGGECGDYRYIDIFPTLSSVVLLCLCPYYRLKVTGKISNYRLKLSVTGKISNKLSITARSYRNQSDLRQPSRPSIVWVLRSFSTELTNYDVLRRSIKVLKCSFWYKGNFVWRYGLWQTKLLQWYSISDGQLVTVRLKTLLKAQRTKGFSVFNKVTAERLGDM